MFGWVDAIPTPASGQNTTVIANVNTVSTWAIQTATVLTNDALQSAIPGSLTLSQSQLDTGVQNLVMYNLPPAVYQALLAKGIDEQKVSLLGVADGGDVNAVLQQQQLVIDGNGNLNVTVFVSGVAVGSAAVSPHALHKSTQVTMQNFGPTISANTTFQVYVTETFDDGWSANLPSVFLKWAVTGDATFNPAQGIVTVGTQNFTLTGTLARAIDGSQSPLSVSGTFTVKAMNYTLTALTIANSPASMFPGQTANLVASATFADGSSLYGAQASWSVDNSAVATINSSSGLLTILNPAVDTPVTVTAQYSSGGVTLSATATIMAKAATNPIVSAAISGSTSALSGVVNQYQISVTYRDGTTGTLQATGWSVSDITLASIGSDGTLNSSRLIHSAPLTLSATVTDPGTQQPFPIPPLTITLLPYQPLSITDVVVHGYTKLGAAQTVTYVVTANLDGEVVDVSSLATFTSSNTGVLSVNGLIATAYNGSGQDQTSTLTASYSGVYSSPLTVTVVPVVATLNSLFIVAPSIVAAGGSANLSAIATWSNGVQKTVGAADGVNFSSDNPAVFTVNNGTLLAAASVSADQTANVNASFADSNNGNNIVAAGATSVTVDMLTTTQYLQQGVNFPALNSAGAYDRFSVNASGGMLEQDGAYLPQFAMAQPDIIVGPLFNTNCGGALDEFGGGWKPVPCFVSPYYWANYDIKAAWPSTVQPDGGLLVLRPSDNAYFTIHFTSVDISGKPVYSYAYMSGTGLTQNSNANFSAGARLITSSSIQTQAGYSLVGPVYGNTATNLDGVVTSTVNYTDFGNSSAGAGTVRFISASSDKKSGTAQLVLAGVSSVVNWHRVQVRNVDMVVFDDASQPYSHLILSMASGLFSTCNYNICALPGVLVFSPLSWGYTTSGGPIGSMLGSSKAFSSAGFNDTANTDIRNSVQLPTSVLVQP